MFMFKYHNQIHLIGKVRYVARYIRKDKSSDRFECRIFTDVQMDIIQHMCARERERERESAHNGERGVP
jgi:hypothetical protein